MTIVTGEEPSVSADYQPVQYSVCGSLVITVMTIIVIVTSDIQQVESLESVGQVKRLELDLILTGQ